MSSVKGAVSKALSDYSEACFGHWLIDGYETDNGVYYLPDSSPRNNTLSTTVSLSAGFNGTSGRGTFDGTSDGFRNEVDAMVGELQVGKEKDPAHVAAVVLPSIIISFNINTTENNTYPVAIRGASGVGIQIDSTGVVNVVWIKYAGGASTVKSTGTVIDDGADHHVCVIIDRGNDRLNIFIDGVAKYSAILNATFKSAADMTVDATSWFGLMWRSTVYVAGQMWNVQCYRTFMDFPAGADAGVALRQAYVDKLKAGNYLTKADIDDVLV